jgi:uncharacterized DUF497 family protein
MYNPLVYEWDETKRSKNLEKHSLDFDDADLVYENPNKITLSIPNRGEDRWQDIALVESGGIVVNIPRQSRRLYVVSRSKRLERGR